MERTVVNFLGLWFMASAGVAAVVWRLSGQKWFISGHSRLYDMPERRGCLLTLAFALPLGLVLPLVVFLS